MTLAPHEVRKTVVGQYMRSFAREELQLQLQVAMIRESEWIVDVL